MTDPSTPSDLGDLLHRATDGIAAPALTGQALRTARRRRTRRRGAVAGGVASALVVAVVGVTQVAGSRSVAPSPYAPTSTGPDAPPTPVDQPRWDPRDVRDLPAAPGALAPALPETLVPPGTSTALSEDPVDAAVAAVEVDGVVKLLATDGSWRHVPLTDDSPALWLSPGGTRLLISYYAEYDGGATVVDLATGAGRVLPWPADYEPYEPSWSFVDDDTVLLRAGRSWTIDADSGRATRVPYDAGALAVAVDPTGAVLTSPDFTEPAVLTDHAGGVAREVSMERSNRLGPMHADAASVVGTSHDRQPFAVVLADRQTMTPRAALPIVNPGDYYGKGGLTVIGLAQDGTVLLRVSDLGRRGAGFHVVGWDPDSGDLTLVSTVPTGQQVAFAEGVLRETGGDDDAGDDAGDAAPSIDPAVVQPVWDPDDVESLPWRDLGIPRDLTPVAGSDFSSTPVAAAVGDEDGLHLLLVGGGWVDAAYPASTPVGGWSVALADDGSRVVVSDGSTIWWKDDAEPGWAATGSPTAVQGDEEAETTLDVLADGVVLASRSGASWLVEPDTWVSRRLPFDDLDQVTAAGAGVVAVRLDDVTRRRAVQVFRNGAVATTIDSAALEGLQRPAASSTSLAATRSDLVVDGGRTSTDADGLIALDLDDLTTRAFLPVADTAAHYSDGAHLTTLGWIDEDVVLARVTPRSDPETTWLVTWEVGTGALARTSSFPTRLGVAVAIDVLTDP